MASEGDVSPPSSVSSRGHERQPKEEGGEGPARRPPRKRRRIIISCTECHRRKQKCDRSLPCTNCVSRNKQGSCRYETGAPTAKALQLAQEQEEEEQHHHHHHPRFGGNRVVGGGLGPSRGLMKAAAADGGGVEPGIPVEMTNFGYSATGASTLGFLRKLDGTNPEESLSRMALGRDLNSEYFGTRERYKSLIRQLPARSYTEKLVDIYFKDFNWQYNVSGRAISGLIHGHGQLLTGISFFSFFLGC